jgi:hypothetical protein
MKYEAVGIFFVLSDLIFSALFQSINIFAAQLDDTS